MIICGDEAAEAAAPRSWLIPTHLFRPAVPGRFPGVWLFSEIDQVTATIPRLSVSRKL